MRPVLTAVDIRQAEERYWEEHPGADLMGRAARAVADHAAQMLSGTRAPLVLVASGRGNNAGDALHAAAELPGRSGATVRIWPVSGTTHQEGFDACVKAGAEPVTKAEAFTELERADLVIDGIAGLGSRALSGETAQFAHRARELGVPVLAVDIPSGLVADSPLPPPDSIRATRTVTFIAHKICQLAAPAAAQCGEVALVDIGVPPGQSALHQVEQADLPAWYPWPTATDDKYSRGVVGFDTGSGNYPGAAVMGVAGALHTGTGMVRHAGEAAQSVVAHWPSIVPGKGRVQAWVCGSGWDMSDHGARRERLAELAADGVPMVLDAGALEVLPDDLPDGCLLTPHAGELARFLGVERAQVEADPIGHARTAAEESGATVLLKGATEYAAEPDGTVLLAPTGPSWNAQAGSGDVLAGICGALLAGGVPAGRAAVLAASLQALAAETAPGPHPPDRLSAVFPGVIAGWERGG